MQTNDYRQLPKYRNGIFKTKEEIIEHARSEGKTRFYHVLSFGGGTQSSHLLEEHYRENIHYDFLVFSNTGAEPQFIHDQVEWWQERQRQYGNTTPFLITTHNSMERGLEEMLMRYIYSDYQRFQMPLHMAAINEDGEVRRKGMLPRQCTGDFKIIPVQQAVRRAIKEQLGLRPEQKIPRDVAIIMDIGFSFDEVNRVGGYVSHQSNYIYLAYPLIEKGLTTADSIRFLEENQFPSRRSRCYMCPFNCDNQDIGMDWKEIIDFEPLSFLKACFFEEELRRVQASGRKNMQCIPYLHNSRQPLQTVYAEDYEQISQQYQEDLNEWKEEWQQFMYNKYDIAIQIDVM